MDFFILENLNYITVVRDSEAPDPPKDTEGGVMFAEEYVITGSSGLSDTGYYAKTRRLLDKPMMYGVWRDVVSRAMLGYPPYPGGVGNSIYGWVSTRRRSSMDRQMLMSDGFYSSGVGALRFKATIPPTGEDSSIGFHTSVRVSDCDTTTADRPEGQGGSGTWANPDGGVSGYAEVSRPVANVGELEGQEEPGTWANPDGGVSGYAEVGRPVANVEGPECWAGNNYCRIDASGGKDDGLLEEGKSCVGESVYDDWSSGWTGTVVNGECVNDGLDVSVTLDRPPKRPRPNPERVCNDDGCLVDGVWTPNEDLDGIVVPPFIEELFPIGSLIDYIDGGMTTVTFPDGGICRFTSDDVFILLMIKESHREQEEIVWGFDEVMVRRRGGVDLTFKREGLDELRDTYHSFWNEDEIAKLNGLEPGRLNLNEVDGKDPYEWKERTPVGWQMSTYVFSAVDKKMNGILGKGAMFSSSPVLWTVPLIAIAKLSLQFMNFVPKPDGRPGQGQAAIFDKDGVQISSGQSMAKMAAGEIVYIANSYGGDPEVLNYKHQGKTVNTEGNGWLPWKETVTIGPITDYGSFYGKLELKHPVPRALDHPSKFTCT